MSIFFRRGSTFEDYVKTHPFTLTIVTINFLMLIFTMFSGGFTITNLNRLGAIYDNVFESGQYWRLFTSAFLHGGIEHFMSNIILGLMFMTAGMETLAGWKKTAVIYFTAILVGGIFVTLRTDLTTIGASGGIYGILGAFLFFTFHKKDTMSKQDRQLIWIFAVLQILTTFAVPYISREGHIGGLVGGFAICYLLFGIYRPFERKYMPKVEPQKDIERIIIQDNFDEVMKELEDRNKEDDQIH